MLVFMLVMLMTAPEKRNKKMAAKDLKSFIALNCISAFELAASRAEAVDHIKAHEALFYAINTHADDHLFSFESKANRDRLCIDERDWVAISSSQALPSLWNELGEATKCVHQRSHC